MSVMGAGREEGGSRGGEGGDLQQQFVVSMEWGKSYLFMVQSAGEREGWEARIQVSAGCLYPDAYIHALNVSFVTISRC